MQSKRCRPVSSSSRASVVRSRLSTSSPSARSPNCTPSQEEHPPSKSKGFQMRPLPRLIAALAAALVLGGLVVTPAAHAAITASQITTPSNPSFFIADEDAGSQTFAISGTTTGGNPANNLVDLRCYFGGGSVKVKGNVPLSSNGSFSVAAAALKKLLDLTCQLRAVPAG